MSSLSKLTFEPNFWPTVLKVQNGNPLPTKPVFQSHCTTEISVAQPSWVTQILWLLSWLHWILSTTSGSSSRRGCHLSSVSFPVLLFPDLPSDSPLTSTLDLLSVFKYLVPSPGMTCHTPSLPEPPQNPSVPQSQMLKFICFEDNRLSG